jgi:hypothetical protein
MLPWVWVAMLTSEALLVWKPVDFVYPAAWWLGVNLPKRGGHVCRVQAAIALEQPGENAAKPQGGFLRPVLRPISLVHAFNHHVSDVNAMWRHFTGQCCREGSQRRFG